MSVGGGKSESSGSSKSSDFSRSFISPDQLPFLKQLWGAASGQILDQGLGTANTAKADEFLKTVGANPYMDSLAQFMTPNNAMAQTNIDLLGQNLTQNLQRNLLPSITDASIQSGGLGGARQGIAQGLALQGTQQALAQGTQDILNNTYNQALGATQFGAGLKAENAIQGITALGQMQQQQFAPLLALAQILGGPTVLSESFGKSQSKQSSESWDANFGFGS